jgi:hypothetical protein
VHAEAGLAATVAAWPEYEAMRFCPYACVRVEVDRFLSRDSHAAARWNGSMPRRCTCSRQQWWPAVSITGGLSVSACRPAACPIIAVWSDTPARKGTALLRRGCPSPGMSVGRTVTTDQERFSRRARGSRWRRWWPEQGTRGEGFGERRRPNARARSEKEATDGWATVAGGLWVTGEKASQLRVRPVKTKRDFIFF